MLDGYTTFVQKKPWRNIYPHGPFYVCKVTESNKPQTVNVTDCNNGNLVLQKCLTVCNEKGVTKCTNA